MSSMVNLATENGSFEYSANLNPLFDSKLLNTISEELSGLGYSVEFTDAELDKVGPVKVLSISWAQQEALTEGTVEQA